MSRFLYPIDTDQFQKIREQGRVYVDKTDLVYDLVNRYSYVFLARPRRFGKSLLCNTLKAYFQGQRELFDGLKIAEREKEWKSYPVLHFDMSELRGCATLQSMANVLSAMLERHEQRFGATKRIEEFGARLSQLIRHIHDSQGEQAVIIIDEYDSPLMRNLYDEEMSEGVRSLLRGFYQTAKTDGAFLRFVFITGVTKFSQLSILSELNNLKQISMLDEYSGLCGITNDELNGPLRPCVEEFAERMGLDIEQAYSILKKNYDGYHFSPRSQDIYAPYSLLNALNDGSANYYWFESATSSALIEHLKRFPEFNPLECDGIELTQEEFNVPCEGASTPIPLLYQSGYLTIGNYCKEDDVFTLRFPNREVRHGMVYGLTSYLMGIGDSDRNATVLTMARALKGGDISAALAKLRSYIASIPYDIIEKKEWMAKRGHEAFYKMLFYVIFSLLNSKVDTEVNSILGRADVVIKTSNDIFVLELKVDSTVESALQQIDDKGYSIPYEADGRNVTKCGVSISSAARNISHWRAVDAKGNIISEQEF